MVPSLPAVKSDGINGMAPQGRAQQRQKEEVDI